MAFPPRVKRSKVCMAVLVTCTTLLLLYSTVHLEVASAKPNLVAATVGNPTGHTLATIRLTTHMVRTNHTTQAQEKFLEVEISSRLAKAIPKNSAFWNRKLHAALQLLERSDASEAQTVESLKTNIADLSSYPSLQQDFLLSMHIRDPDILINQPNKCTSKGEAVPVMLLFAIKSAPGNFLQRQAVRETWGKEGMYEGRHVRTVFLLGTKSSPDDPDLSQLTSLEAAKFGDLLIWNFRDSFYNLTLKEHAFLRWSVNHCPQASFVFKGDDDVFVNTRAIIKYLQSIEKAKISKLYLGQIIMQATPLRDHKSKYYVPQTFYDGPYPPYAGGGGFLFSGALLEALHNISMRIPFYPIDDVYTGMCFHALGISAEKHSGFQTFDIREQDRENACVHKGLLMVHRRSPQQAIRIWRNMESPMLTC